MNSGDYAYHRKDPAILVADEGVVLAADGDVGEFGQQFGMVWLSGQCRAQDLPGALDIAGLDVGAGQVERSVEIDFGHRIMLRCY